MMAQECSFKLTIDAREKYLRALITEGGSVRINTLDLGDVMCEYQDGSAWILERKTIHDNRQTNSNSTTCLYLSLSLSLSLFIFPSLFLQVFFLCVVNRTSLYRSKMEGGLNKRHVCCAQD